MINQRRKAEVDTGKCYPERKARCLVGMISGIWLIDRNGRRVIPYTQLYPYTFLMNAISGSVR